MSRATRPSIQAWRFWGCSASFYPLACGICGGRDMSIFGEVQPPSGRNSEDVASSVIRRIIRPAAILAALLVAAVIFFNYIAAVTRIGAGYVGIEIFLSGSQRGPSEIPIKTGWVFYSPLRSQIIEFPTYIQTVKWTRDLNEGRPMNEEMSYNSKEGMEIYSDVSISYAVFCLKKKNRRIRCT